jgi:hypothetical protein
MSHSLAWLLACLALVATLAPLAVAQDEEVDTANPLAPRRPFEPRAVEMTMADRSVLRLYLADEKIEIATPHGTLKIPAEDVLRLEFAQRLPEGIARLVDEKLQQLRDPDPNVQKAVGAELVAMREQAYLALLNASKSGDPGIASQAGQVLQRLRKTLSKKDVDGIRTDDMIITADMKIAGQITSPALRIRTSQFGELALKLADARSLRHQSLIAPEAAPKAPVSAQPDPGNLKAFESQQGKVLAFSVTGAAGGGGIWGTDSYTTDSRLAMAAVHAGVLQAGETGVVYVKVTPSPASFTGSVRNGVSTSGYGTYTAAYEFVMGEEEE